MTKNEILLQRIIKLENRLNIVESDIERNCEVANYNQKNTDKLFNKLIKKIFWKKRKVEYVNYIPNKNENSESDFEEAEFGSKSSEYQPCWCPKWVTCPWY
jgi:hypothetical protein